MSLNENRRILIVDDNPAIHHDFRKILCPALKRRKELDAAAAELFGNDVPQSEPAEKFELTTADQGEEALQLVRESVQRKSPFSLAFVDVRMPPGWDGVKTVGHLWDVDPRIQVVICTAHSDYSQERMMNALGRNDRWLILKKPFDTIEVHQLAIALTRKWSLSRNAELTMSDLQKMADERASQIAETRDVAMFALAKLAESRDPETGEHLERIRAYTRILAEELSVHGPYCDEIDERFIADLYLCSPLHDIGKVGIPDTILLKPGQLTYHEFEIMKRHTEIGAVALESSMARNVSAGFLSMAVDVTRYHHERFDGTGYLAGLRGTEIPLSARIVALADVYDALTSVRVYKDAFDSEVARTMIEQESGSHFDPAIVEAFQNRFDEFVSVETKLQPRLVDAVAAAPSA